MKARFFYAAPIFTNTPKLLVLTSDGTLYSEVKEFQITQIEKSENHNFEAFDIKSFENEDYPVILEVDYQEAKEMVLNGQPNWIDNYINVAGAETTFALQAS